MNLHRITVLSVAALLSAPAAAFAQDATQDGYGDGGEVQETVAETTAEPAVAGESATPAPQAAPAAEELPFTGDDEIIIALAGALLVGTGVAMRRIARTN